MALDFKSDPSVGDLETGPGGRAAPNQLDLAKKPQRFRFQIVYNGAANADIGKVLGRTMLKPQENIVDQVDLKINPSQYRVSEPTREGVTQTISGAWVDYYGLGLPKITMSGTTGWRPSTLSTKKTLGALLGNIALAASGISTAKPNPPTGLADFIYLRNRIFRTYAVLLQRLNVDFSKRIQTQLQLRFYAWDTQDYYVVLIDTFELSRNSARPLLYDYNIQMTVIGYVGDRQEIKDYLAEYWKPTSRLSAISAALKRWKANAQLFQNSVNAFSRQLSDDINSFTNGISTLTDTVDAVVGGTSTFITLPFTTVTLIAAQARALGDFVAHVESVPTRLRDDLHNAIIEASCSLAALRTYQSLFSQPFGDAFSDAPWKNLTCSSSLGIPPNPTLPETGVSVPSQPASAINAGVYDPETIQGSPSGVDNFTTRSTSPFRLREVVIREGMTVEALIQSIGGLDINVAQVWQQVVTLNGLEYPYIAPNVSFQSDFRATVNINIYGTPGTSVPSGTLVGTQQIASPEDVIVFNVLQTVIIAANGMVTVQAEATRAGSYANVNAFSIVQVVNIAGQTITIVGVDRVENAVAAAGGRIIRVLRPGQKLKVPVPQSTAVSETVVSRTETVEQDLFGNDIFLDEEGDFQSDGKGDISTVKGIENMKVALIDRLTTEQGELTKHPDYGAPIARIIGEPGDQNALTVARLELKSTLLQDPRIKGVDNLSLKKTDDALNVDMNLRLIDETTRATNAELPVDGI